MEIVDSHHIQKAAQLMQACAVVGFPTETSYGLLTNIHCPDAVRRIFKIKQRSLNMPLSVLVKDARMAEDIAHIDQTARIIIDNVYPAPLTLIFKAKKDILGITKDGSIALRISSKKEIKELFQYINTPLTATSANISGHPDLYSEHDIMKEYAQKERAPDVIFFGGKLKKQQPTTMIDLTSSPPRCVREGELPCKKIMRYLNKVLT